MRPLGIFRSAVFATLALILVVSPSSATGPVLIDDSASSPNVEALDQAAACTLAPGPIDTPSSYAWTTPDAWENVYWRVPPPCPACGSGSSLALQSLSFRVRWFGACNAQAEVSVVGSSGPSGCRVPNPSDVRCGPTLHAITGTASAGVIHTLPIPTGCCVGSDVFVRVRFIGLGSCYPSGPSPGITRATSPCVACSQYITSTVSTPAITDACTVQSNPLWMELAADCCSPVGVGDDDDVATTRIAVHQGHALPIRMTIALAGAASRAVEVDVFDVTGRRVRTLLRGELSGGNHPLVWDGASDRGERLSRGWYRVRLKAGDVTTATTALLIGP